MRMGNLLIYSAAEIFYIWPRALPRCRPCRALPGRLECGVGFRQKPKLRQFTCFPFTWAQSWLGLLAHTAGGGEHALRWLQLRSWIVISIGLWLAMRRRRRVRVGYDRRDGRRCTNCKRAKARARGTGGGSPRGV